jgi:UDP-N-acetylmuramoyl-tripeptide--D-alanyl-D-alanine ligase
MSHSHHLENITSIIYSNVKSNFDLKINTDSRSFKAGETFVCLVGDSFDGFNYVEQVLKENPSCVVFEDKEERRAKLLTWETMYPEVNFITVTNGLIFIQELAKLHILEWKQFKAKRKVIGVTGSNGKTTHKEMIKYLCESIMPGKILATKGNLNNHIGVPLTIFNLSNEHEVAIIEMGMNHPGEIEELTQIAGPEHGMITNIGAAHIEFMKSMENIFVEKSTLYKSVLINSKGEGMFVVNADDEYLNRLEHSNGLTTYGEKNGDVIVSIKAPEIKFNFLNQEFKIINSNISEHHNLKNLVGTTIFVMKLFPEKALEIAQAASNYEQPKMNRSQWTENIFLDAYNANPSSMRVSLNSFVEIMKSKEVSIRDCYFVIGDMNELGDFAEEMHKEIGNLLKELEITNLTFLGRYRDFYMKGYSNPQSHYLTKEEFYDEWKKIRKSYKYIFVKASRSLQLESLIGIF